MKSYIVLPFHLSFPSCPNCPKKKKKTLPLILHFIQIIAESLQNNKEQTKIMCPSFSQQQCLICSQYLILSDFQSYYL